MSDKHELVDIARGELIVPSEPIGNIARDIANARNDFYTSWPLATPEARVDALRGFGPSTLQLSALIGETIAIEKFLIHEVEFQGDNPGEVEEGIRVVLYTPTGETISCCSKGVYNALKRICGSIGAGPWRPALLCKVVQGSSKGVNRYYTLVAQGWLDNQPEAKTAKGSKK